MEKVITGMILNKARHINFSIELYSYLLLKNAIYSLLIRNPGNYRSTFRFVPFLNCYTFRYFHFHI